MLTTRIDQHGNTVKTGYCGGDRYRFDFNVCTSKDGWEQYDTDQDAWYFGIWINKGRRMIVMYAEGDMTITECPSAHHFNLELVRMNRYHGEGFIAKVIEPVEGSMTVFCQDRSGLFIGLLPQECGHAARS